MNSIRLNRLLNLDLIRAFAIILVLYYHVTQMLIGNLFTNRTLFYFGHHGVTIFFVLSGFLIGGIYYKKEHIKASKFWLSRFLRTYPPYLVMLFVSWVSVYIVRKESFDFGFLFLIQNFYKEIPYFLVSWSLAVEEHFYLLFALFILGVKHRKTQFYFWILLSILPILFRIIFYDDVGEFGFYKTASFLHIDSLATGVVIAYLVHIKKIAFKTKPWHIFISFFGMITIFYIISKYENIYTWSLGRTLANISIGCWLLFSYYYKTIKLAKSSFVKQTAIMAYSLYLVHPLVIHFSVMVFKKFSISSIYIQYSATLALIYMISYPFYILVEKRSIQIRDRLLRN